MKSFVYVLAGLALVISGAAGRGDEKKVPLSEVPESRARRGEGTVPGAELKEAEKEVDEDEATFEISLTAAGKHVTVSVDDEGEIEEIETELSIAGLPKAVADAIAAKFAKATIKKAEELVEIDDGKEDEVLRGAARYTPETRPAR